MTTREMLVAEAKRTRDVWMHTRGFGYAMAAAAKHAEAVNALAAFDTNNASDHPTDMGAPMDPLKNITSPSEMAEITRMVLTAQRVRRGASETPTFLHVSQLFPDANRELLTAMVHQLEG